MDDKALKDLIDRLRGIYRIPIQDGLGPSGGGEEPNNPSEHVERFETTRISREAAGAIEKLIAERDEAIANAARWPEACGDAVINLMIERDKAAEAMREAAARWHEAHARHCADMGSKSVAIRHGAYAAAIRALPLPNK